MSLTRLLSEHSPSLLAQQQALLAFLEHQGLSAAFEEFLTRQPDPRPLDPNAQFCYDVDCQASEVLILTHERAEQAINLGLLEPDLYYTATAGRDMTPVKCLMQATSQHMAEQYAPLAPTKASKALLTMFKTELR